MRTLRFRDCQLPYVGDIDDVRIWKNALSKDDVEDRYKGKELKDDYGPDTDKDGVSDYKDACPYTKWEDRYSVSERGCSCDQVEKKVGETCKTTYPACYRNHGAYVSCVSKKLDYLQDEGIATYKCAEHVQEEAAHSGIGKTELLCSSYP